MVTQEQKKVILDKMSKEALVLVALALSQQLDLWNASLARRPSEAQATMKYLDLLQSNILAVDAAFKANDLHKAQELVGRVIKEDVILQLRRDKVW